MLLHELCRKSGVTKKAVAYYAQQGLLCPATQENGYRDFTEEDAALLKKISILRKAGCGVEQCKAALADPRGETLQRVVLQSRLNLQQESARHDILSRLSDTGDWTQAETQLCALEQNRKVLDQLQDAFPGYYGRLLCLHFAPYLQHTLEDSIQRKAYEEVLAFLDNVPTPEFPPAVQALLDETVPTLTTDTMELSQQAMRDAIEDPETFLTQNKTMLEEYMALKQSEEFQTSAAAQLQTCLRAFSQNSGYNDVFLPAMRRLSPSYAAYYEKLMAANEVLLRHYPQAAQL